MNRLVENADRLGRKFAQHLTRSTQQPMRQRLAVDQFQSLQGRGLTISSRDHLVPDRTAQRASQRLAATRQSRV